MLNTSKDITIAIADDHSLFREGLAAVLNDVEGIKIVIQAENGKDLIEKLQKKRPQVVLMDVRMVVMDGIETTEYLREHYPEINILGISMLDEKRFIVEMIKAGGHGYLNKNTSSRELKKAIFSVHEKGYYFNKNVTEAIHEGWFNRNKNKVDVNGITLSVREDQILNLLCKQLSTVEMADKLSLSPRTVENYRSKLIDKTGVKNTAGLVMHAIVNGLVKLDLELKN